MTSTKTELQEKPLKLIIGQSNVGRVKKKGPKNTKLEKERAAKRTKRERTEGKQ